MITFILCLVSAGISSLLTIVVMVALNWSKKQCDKEDRFVFKPVGRVEIPLVETIPPPPDGVPLGKHVLIHADMAQMEAEAKSKKEQQ